MRDASVAVHYKVQGVFMTDRREWHRPMLQFLDVQATAQTSDPGAGIDHLISDPQSEGDLPEVSETVSAFGTPHAQADAS